MTMLSCPHMAGSLEVIYCPVCPAARSARAPVRVDWRYCRPFHWTIESLPVIWSVLDQYRTQQVPPLTIEYSTKGGCE